MALIFQRLARNFAKNGYFPTDAGTIEGILRLLKQPENPGTTRIIDPCCGEGTALAEVANYLKQSETYGIELDEERAWHSKEILDTVIHGDIQDCLIGQRQFSLMFFNPPYGDLVADKTDYEQKQGGRQRLEKQFYQITKSYLQFGGIGITIVPHYVLDKHLSTWLATHYTDIQVYQAAVDTFKQVVIVGKRQRAESVNTETKNLLMGIGNGDITPLKLPREGTESVTYLVPETVELNRFRFEYVKTDPKQLLVEINKHPVLWNGFNMHFSNTFVEKRRPLRKMTEWHMALLLAAGYINGLVTSNDGTRTYLIKGDTHKKKDVKVTYSGDEAEVVKTTTSTDRFVPMIRAIDFTPGPNYGNVLTIK